MPDPAARLATLAHDLLDAIEQGADTHDVELPARRFVSTGALAWDCPLLAVTTPTITRGRPGRDSANVNRESDTFVVTYEVLLLRYVPIPDDDGNPPHVDALLASADELLRDGWLLTVGIAGALRTIEQSCTALAQTSTTAVGPEGGLAGWSSSLQVAL